MKKGIDFDLYPELKGYKDQFENSVRAYIKIETIIDNQMDFWQSKFGGNPYWPKEVEYPKDSVDNPMILIAQLNFEEIPNLEGFPTKGILQFFISQDRGLYGIDGYKFEEMINQKDFRVLYFPKIEKKEENIITDFSFLPNPTDLDPYPPILKACSLNFKKNYAPVACFDYQFEQLFGDPFKFFEQFDYEFIDLYSLDYSARGHKIGGYADFAQVDPRKPEWGYKLLLLQIDSEPSKDIDFGSAGVAHLFIKEEDLINHDFSKVMYHWDCG